MSASSVSLNSGILVAVNPAVPDNGMTVWAVPASRVYVGPRVFAKVLQSISGYEAAREWLLDYRAKAAIKEIARAVREAEQQVERRADLIQMRYGRCSSLVKFLQIAITQDADFQSLYGRPLGHQAAQ